MCERISNFIQMLTQMEVRVSVFKNIVVPLSLFSEVAFTLQELLHVVRDLGTRDEGNPHNDVVLRKRI